MEREETASKTHMTGKPTGYLVKRYDLDGVLLDTELSFTKPVIRSTSKTEFVPLFASQPPQDHLEGDNQPRYTTKRLHDEIANAKGYSRREALQDAARVADEEAEMWGYNGGFSARVVAERIRKLVSEDSTPPETKQAFIPPPPSPGLIPMIEGGSPPPQKRVMGPEPTP